MSLVEEMEATDSDGDIDLPLLFSRIENLEAPFAINADLSNGTSNKSLVFPQVLYQLLEKSEQEGFTSIVSWLPGNRGFKVHKREEFVSNVLPNYFKQTKIKSFHRQLNIYGFERINQGRDVGAYRHNFFIRGRPELVDQIERLPVKKDVASA